jgi:hypothetical protein
MPHEDPQWRRLRVVGLTGTTTLSFCAMLRQVSTVFEREPLCRRCRRSLGTYRTYIVRDSWIALDALHLPNGMVEWDGRSPRPKRWWRLVFREGGVDGEHPGNLVAAYQWGCGCRATPELRATSALALSLRESPVILV